jgi:hypothetical protein
MRSAGLLRPVEESDRLRVPEKNNHANDCNDGHFCKGVQLAERGWKKLYAVKRRPSFMFL